MSSGRPPRRPARAARARFAVVKKRSRPGMPSPLSSRNWVAAARLARRTGASPPVARCATCSTPMKADFGIRPDMVTSLDEGKRRAMAERVHELGRQRSLAGFSDRPPQTDGPVVPDFDAQLPPGALDG